MQCLYSNNRRTGGILGTTREKTYQEFGLESLESRNLKSLEFFSFFFLLILKNKSPDYLFSVIPQSRSSYIEIFDKHNVYKNSFCLSTTDGWNNLDQDLRNSESYTFQFRSSILGFIRPSPNTFYGCQNVMAIKLVTRLRLGLSHLRENKFKQSFQDT